MQGGGWCTSYSDCADRAGTHYGSSLGWTRSGPCPDAANPACWGDSPSGAPAGLQSLDATQSPQFYNATHVFLAYCDGASFSGDQDSPHHYNSSLSLHFRGRSILDGVLDALFARHGLGQAREVLLKGCSAGGMATYIHADYIGERLRARAPGVVYAAAPGAGMFLDQPAYGVNGSFTPLLLWGYVAQNASGSVSAACAAAPPRGDPSLCYLAPHALPYIRTPLFIANSLVDSCALDYLMVLGCDPREAGNCTPAQLGYVSQYRANMLGVVAPVLAANAAHGAFLQACWTHIVEDDEVSWTRTTVQGQTQVDTFGAWWAGVAAGGGGGRRGAGLKTVVVDGEWGSNPTCSNLGGCD